MKRISMVLAAVALVLGLSQCKKQEQQTTTDTNGTVAITLDVRANNGSRIDVNTTTGTVKFKTGDVVYVASGQKFVGTLTNNGNTFAGNITNPTEGEPLYFFFLGNKTPEESLTPGSSTTCSVNISNQTSGYPVISFATSNEIFTGAGLYTAFFLNKAALVKFDVTTLSSNPTCILGLNNKVTVDFSTNGFAYSQVDNGLVKLSGYSGVKWAILLPQSALAEGEDGSIYTEEGGYTGTRPAIPAITANDYLNEGIALVTATETNPSTAPVPEGAVSGKFTINSNGDRVYISQGNLQYQASTNTWRFAEYQYDFVGGTNDHPWYGDGGEYGNVYENEVKCSNNAISSAYSGWIDLFGWGTSGYNHGAVCYQPWSTSTNSSDYYAYGEYTYNLYDQSGKADWGYNAISNGGNTEGQWRTLTTNEWRYLFYERATLSGIRYATANVNGVNGFILLPNEWDASIYDLNYANSEGFYSANTITGTDWTNVFEANGAVFLPFTGSRVGSSFRYLNGGGGYYWSSSHYDNYNSFHLWFETYLYPYCTGYAYDYDNYGSRPIGFSVRLVHDVE